MARPQYKQTKDIQGHLESVDLDPYRLSNILRGNVYLVF